MCWNLETGIRSMIQRMLMIILCIYLSIITIVVALKKFKKSKRSTDKMWFADGLKNAFRKENFTPIT